MEKESDREKEPLEDRLSSILNRYGKLLAKMNSANEKPRSYAALDRLCECDKVEKARLRVIRCLVNKKILSYSPEGNYEVRLFHDFPLDPRLLKGPQGEALYPTNIKYAHKLMDFLAKHVYPDPGTALSVAEARA